MVSIDWYKIEIEDLISGVSANYVLNQCFVSGVSSFCDDFKRDATGQITSLNRGNANLGQVKTSGYDFSVHYRFPSTSWGNFNARLDGTYVSSYEVKSTATSDWVDYAGFYDGYAYYKLRTNLAVDWTLGPWSVTWTARYFDKTKSWCWSDTEMCTNPDAETDVMGVGYNQIGSQTFHDIAVGYKTPWKGGQVLAGINNVFAKGPTLDISNSYAIGSGGPSSSSSVNPNLPIDRFFWVRYNQGF
jgi:iron complex outermembrane receptor protein